MPPAIRGGLYWIEDSEGNALTDVKVGDSPRNPAGYAEDPGVDHDDEGTYLVFSGLSAANIVIVGSTVDDEGIRAPINGVQLVSAGGGNDIIDRLSEDLVSYWPLDEITTDGLTEDFVSAYDMEATNLGADNVVEGKFGNAISFSNADKTLLSRKHGADDDLPANKHDSFTVSFWSKVNGTGQNDLRLFSESNTLGENNPLFNIGTHNTGSDGSIDIYIRNSGWPTVGHIFSTAEPFDGEWHHVVFVQDNLERSLYVDGVLDDLAIPAKPESGWDNLNATTIGGILRGSAVLWVTGVIDEVAIWKRGLSADEVAEINEFSTILHDDILPNRGNANPALSVVNNGDGTVTITFEGTLQAAPTVNGPWENVDGASPMTISSDQAQQFGRAVK
jgi:hypothetical protein